MAITEAYTQNAITIGGTEYSLPNNSTTPAAITDDGIYQVLIETVNLAANDEYAIRIKEKVYAAGAQRIAMTATLVGQQAEPIWVSPSLILLHGWDVTVQKVAGTDRAFSWSIRKVA